MMSFLNQGMTRSPGMPIQEHSLGNSGVADGAWLGKRMNVDHI